MLIGTEYRIEADTLQVWLSRRVVIRRGDHQGEERWRPIAYYPTMAGALQHLVDLEVRETKLADLRTVVAKQAELHRLIEGLALPGREDIKEVEHDGANAGRPD